MSNGNLEGKLWTSSVNVFIISCSSLDSHMTVLCCSFLVAWSSQGGDGQKLCLNSGYGKGNGENVCFNNMTQTV